MVGPPTLLVGDRREPTFTEKAKSMMHKGKVPISEVAEHDTNLHSPVGMPRIKRQKKASRKGVKK